LHKQREAEIVNSTTEEPNTTSQETNL